MSDTDKKDDKPRTDQNSGSPKEEPRIVVLPPANNTGTFSKGNKPKK